MERRPDPPSPRDPYTTLPKPAAAPWTLPWSALGAFAAGLLFVGNLNLFRFPMPASVAVPPTADIGREIGALQAELAPEPALGAAKLAEMQLVLEAPVAPALPVALPALYAPNALSPALRATEAVGREASSAYPPAQNLAPDPGLRPLVRRGSRSLPKEAEAGQ